MGAGATTTKGGMSDMPGMTGMGHGEHGDEGADCSPSGTTLSIVASDTKFNAACLAAPANQAVTLSYENKDTIGHSIAILESHTATEVLFRADIFTGPRTMTFNIPALRAGTYAFHCEVHPAVMKGTFAVK
jgi:plastocyanin